MPIFPLRLQRSVLVATAILLAACSPPDSTSPAETVSAAQYELILRGGTIYDGSGEPGFAGDVAINGDAIVALGDLGAAGADRELDVTGLAVAPGFINMLSWATESLIHDGRSQSDIRQGVTLEVFGEGFSMGPLSDDMKMSLKARQSDIRYEVEWTTLGEYLEYLVARGVSTNVATFLGAANPRMAVIGLENRKPTADELDAMRDIVREAMEDGAIGVASSLMYPPGLFADTGELIALAEVAAEYDGLYASHMRDEGAHMLEAIEELITISRESGISAEIYHHNS